MLLLGRHLHGGSDRSCRFGSLPPVPLVPVLGTPNATCRVPPAEVMGDAPLRVTLNGQQYTAAAPAARFAFLPPIATLTASPAAGPTDGATRLLLTGHAGFADGSHLLCRFARPLPNSVFSTTLATVDAVVVAPPHRTHAGAELAPPALACSTPPETLPAGDIALEVALNGQQFSNASLLLVSYPPPTLHSLSPASGPLEGGTTVVLAASGLNPGVHFQCRFVPPAAANASAVVVPATPRARADDAEAAAAAVDELICRTPAATNAAWGVTQVQASLNGQQFTPGGIGFEYYPPLVVSGFSPTSGPVGGATRVLLDGHGFRDSWELQCRFHRAVVNTTYLSPSQAR